MVVQPLPAVLFPEQRWIAATHRTWCARRVAVLSSRIGREFERRGNWFDCLHRGLEEWAATDRVALTCAGTTCHRYLIHAARERGLPCVQCEMPTAGETFARWTGYVTATDWAGDNTHRLSVSPAAAQAEDRTGELSTFSVPDCPIIPLGWPLADRLLAGLGEEIYVLLVRPGGNLERIVTHHLSHHPAWPQRWMLAVGSDLVPPALAERWMEQGAVAWTPPPVSVAGPSRKTLASSPPVIAACETPDGAAQQKALARVKPLRSVPCDRYLTHWTRRQPGPWPDESESQFLQSLLINPRARDRSALASLLRIVRMQRLIATNQLTRGETKVVCFTAQPLTSFIGRRIFRAMHGRWDFEPYGVCIERDWLIGRGARAVIYGDESTWQQLTEPDRPYFQHRGSALAGHPCDWTQEDEWRYAGDVELSQIPPRQVLVFVPDSESAVLVSTVSPWAVTIAD